MNARSGGLSAFDRAKSAALVVAKNLGPEDTLTLVEVGAQPRERVQPLHPDAKDVEEEIDRSAKRPHRAATSSPPFMHLFGPDAPKRTNPLVYLFTDCQASGWREVKNQGLAGPHPRQDAVRRRQRRRDRRPVQPGRRSATRRGAAGPWPGCRIYLQPRVVNSSKTETAEVTLSVLIEDKEVSRTTLTLKPGETAVRRIPYTPREAGRPARPIRDLQQRRPTASPTTTATVHAQRLAAHQGRDRGRPAAGQPIADADEAHYLDIALTAGVQLPGGRQAAVGGRRLPRPFDVQVIPEARA